MEFTKPDTLMRKTCVACHNINKLHYKTGFCNFVTKEVGKVQNTKTDKNMPTLKQCVCDSEIVMIVIMIVMTVMTVIVISSEKFREQSAQPLAADNLTQDYPIFHILRKGLSPDRYIKVYRV